MAYVLDTQAVWHSAQSGNRWLLEADTDCGKRLSSVMGSEEKPEPHPWREMCPKCFSKGEAK